MPKPQRSKSQIQHQPPEHSQEAARHSIISGAMQEQVPQVLLLMAVIHSTISKTLEQLRTPFSSPQAPLKPFHPSPSPAPQETKSLSIVLLQEPIRSQKHLATYLPTISTFNTPLQQEALPGTQ